MIVPPSLLADVYAFAVAFVRWETSHDWRCWPRPQAAVEARKQGVPPHTHAVELAAVRARCAEVIARRTADGTRQTQPPI
jgi:hypothetical protein